MTDRSLIIQNADEMSRPKSAEKRDALLSAAAELVGELGISAPTSKIAQRAGVAEGTLFTYFPDKDALLGELHETLSEALWEASIGQLPQASAPKEKLRRLWDAHLDWYQEHPVAQLALPWLALAHEGDLARARKRELAQLFSHSWLASGARASSEVPAAFWVSFFEGLAKTTLDFIARDRMREEIYRRAGLEALWNCLPR
jgi:AcrR family transcriptional regulator